MHLQLNDLSVGDYVTDKYALRLDFRMIDENVLHGTGKRIGRARGRITLQITKEAETGGELTAYVYLIMDAQLNIQTKCSILSCTRKMLRMTEPHKAVFVAATGVEKTHLTLDLLVYRHHLFQVKTQ